MKTLEFRNVGEIRMGSPYNGAEAYIDGILVESSAQDLGVISENGDFAVLVRWDLLENAPAFRVVRFDSAGEGMPPSRRESPRFEGAVQEMRLDERHGRVQLRVWKYDPRVPMDQSTHALALDLATLAPVPT